MKNVKILVFRGVPTLYSYKNTDQTYNIGDHVIVPFGRYPVTGLIVEEDKNTTFKTPLKAIIELDQKKPTIPNDLIRLILWFSSYYHTTPYKAYQTIIGKKTIRECIKNELTKHVNQSPPLTIEQNHVIQSINKSKGFNEYVLHGVTSSGKTEVYLQIAKTQLEQKKQVIICLPEIALTPQFTQIFEDRFGNDLVVVHSGLTPKQRDVAWNEMKQGLVNIVIGPRSAIFSPFKEIGTIIIDEEHETTYKQDQHPRYYTHTVASQRAKTHNASLILGSATPAIDTYHPFKRNKKEYLLEMKNRVFNRPLPSVELVDMRQQIIDHQAYFISIPLKEAISNALKEKQKVILLVNRRGFSTHIQCTKCGETHDCPKCKLSLTYHKDKTLRCHRCDIVQPLTHTCKKCKRNSLSYSGTGIQKIEIEIKRMFQDANVIRLDKDEAKTAKQVHKVLKEFKDNGDILIGTQMIAKGHHIESVSTVGVIGIDSTLNIPDFRSPERTFQLVTQVAGRAGRGEIPGRVIVQTSQPEHYALETASQHDYVTFYNEEVQFREALNYPPYCKLVNILFSSLNNMVLKKHINKAFNEFKHQINAISHELQLMGPKPAPIEQINNYFRYNLLIKYNKSNEEQLKEAIKSLQSRDKNVRVITDFDPRSIL